MFSVSGVVILFLLLFAIHVVELEASGKGTIKFKRFRYDNCDDPNGCDFYFANIKIVGGDGSPQTTGTKTAPDNTNNVDLTSLIPEFTNIVLATNGSVTLSMEVWDYDRWSADELETDIKDENVDFSLITLGSDWKDKKFDYRSGNSHLTISYQITSCDANFTGSGCSFCEDNHYTSTCDRYCAPVTGNYTCNSNGDKVCEAWKTGANCDQCITGRKGPDCAQCDNDYYGTNCSVHCSPESTQYSCSANGTKVCEGHWNGTECNECTKGYHGDSCDSYCVPVANRYNCNDSGDKECVARRRGIDCELCETDWYGTNCSVNCVEKPGQYSCSTDGTKVCEGHWNGTDCNKCSTGFYGNSCSTYCPSSEHYNCSETGEKICKSKWVGVNCDTCEAHWDIAKYCDECEVQWAGDNCSVCSTGYYGTSCSTYCSPTEHYNCSETGQKICMRNWKGTNCDICDENRDIAKNCDECEVQWAGDNCSVCSTGFYGSTCSVYCFPTEHYNCTETGEKICSSGEVTFIADNCESSASPLDLKVIGGAGGGGAVVLILIVVMLTVFLLRRRKSEEKTKSSDMLIVNPTFHASSDALEIAPTQNPVYSTVNKSEAGCTNPSLEESVDADEGTTYADVAFVKGTRKGGRSNDVSGPDEDENTATYADMAFSNRAAVETTYADIRTARDEDETTYADLTFVKKAGRGKEESAVFLDTEQGEATYLTVTDIF